MSLHVNEFDVVEVSVGDGLVDGFVFLDAFLEVL